MLWACSLYSANRAAGENAMCSRQVMWLPLLGGSLLAAAWEGQPTPSKFRISDGCRLGHFCMTSTYETFSVCFHNVRGHCLWTSRGGHAKGRIWAWAPLPLLFLSVCVWLFFPLWYACEMSRFICIRQVERGCLSEKKCSIHTTLWFEGSKC